MKGNTFILFLFFHSFFFSQEIPNDTIIGKIKSVKDKVIVLKENNGKYFFNVDNRNDSLEEKEYFRIPNYQGFYKVWMYVDGSGKLNSRRSYDENRNIRQIIVFDYNDNELGRTDFYYDKNNRLTSEKENSNLRTMTVKYYRDSFGNENIIRLYKDSFHHIYNKYSNDKIIRKKYFNKNSSVEEYVYNYDSKGNLIYRIFKNPKKWKDNKDGSFSYGIIDSTGVQYKDIVKEYDANNNLIRQKLYDLYDNTKYQNIALEKEETLFFYNDKLLTKKKVKSNNFSVPSYYFYDYDKNHRLIKKYCCSENKNDATLSYEYYYENSKIVKSLYKELNNGNYSIDFKYRYDKNNNWIEIIKIINGLPSYKWIREIEYYE